MLKQKKCEKSGKVALRFSATIEQSGSQKINSILLKKASGGQKVIALDEDKIAYILQKMRQIEESVNDKLQHVAQEIDLLCDENYQIPSVTPRIREMSSFVQSSLSGAQSFAIQTIVKVDDLISAVKISDK